MLALLILVLMYFNQESTPRRLGNWEVPRWAPTRPRPLEYRPDPKPICDINGHFLPGAPRGTSRCFGHYTGTWELPKRITREVAAKLSKEPPDGRFPDWLHLRVQRPEAVASLRFANKEKQAEAEEAERQRIEEESYKDKQSTNKIKTESADNNTSQFNSIDNRNKNRTTETNENKELNKEEETQIENNCDRENLFEEKKQPVNQEGHGPYVPGSLTDPDKRHESYDLLVKEAVEKVHGPQEDETEKFWRKVHENAKKNEENMKETRKETFKLPQVNVTHNFQFAKKMHVGNLEHQPLPDTLGYRNLSKIAEHRDSDIVVKPYAIGWKGYGASGPTCCTKMRVHRPKTSDPKKTDADNDDKMRPSTSAPDLGGQLKKPMSLMDLAICWDFRPDDPKQEPRPPKHVDGSNGCRAPAVFTMIHTPKDEVEDGFQLGHTNPIFNQNRRGDDKGHHPVPYFEKDMTKEKRKDTCEVQYCPQHESCNSAKGSNGKRSKQNSAKPECDGIHGCGTPSDNGRKSSRDKLPENLYTVKNGWTNEGNHQINSENNSSKRNSLEPYEKTPLAQGKLLQSSPNDSQLSRRTTKDSLSTNNNNNKGKHRHCSSCNGSKPPQEIRHKEDYKFAFKAGNPNSVQSVSSSTDSKGVKMPKMRHPYTKKSYTIPTLAPPFSIWKDANATGYPEHWRLASVYQHAFKPPDQRRKPLMSCVYQ